ncbi:integrase [Alteromonas gilva]|uniref:Integrase n=1 Tax=Alteromonas gilva TaxID=2987522 RepID=A0ABT5KY66_9ALTE|nr:integrase [Alteromonas gilva]MDC8829710.1 integrase [Alteromonas gilva]
MSNIVTFEPKDKLNQRENVEAFIEFGKALLMRTSSRKYTFDDNYWPKVGNFTRMGVHSQNRDPENLLNESILPFAKAYVAYASESKSDVNKRFYALRAINEVIINSDSNLKINNLSRTEFDDAANYAVSKLGKGAANQTGQALKKLHTFLIEKRMIEPFDWKNPIAKPKGEGTDDQSLEDRESKMPDENAVMAIAQISSYRTEELSSRDIHTTSRMALLFAAPSRGSEPSYLRAQCLQAQQMTVEKALKLGLEEDDVRTLLARQSGKEEKSQENEDNDNTELDLRAEITLKGISWFSGKGYNYELKWLPTVMYDAVTTAIERQQEQSKRARSVAKLLEDSDDFPRHELCPKVSEDKLLTMDQVALALGFDLKKLKSKRQMQVSRNQLLKRKGIERKDFVVSLRDLNKIVRRDLPEGFPYVKFKNDKVKLKWSEALYAGFKNSLDSDKTEILTEFFIPQINILNDDLAPTKKKNRLTGELSSRKSIFERWGFGQLRMTSHQLRHLIDTMAAVNGMSEELRAKWAQRSDPRHNSYYNHVTPEEYGADFLEDRESQLASLESIPIKVHVANPQTLQELNTKTSLTAHATEFGMCMLSYLNESCTKFRDCLNCAELHCVKGDKEAEDRLREKLKLERKLLAKDEKAMMDKIPGAERWFQKRKIRVERGTALIQRLEDPALEDGTVIKLANVEDVSHVDRALEKNGKKRLPKITNFKRLKRQNSDDENAPIPLIDKNNTSSEDIDLDDLDGYIDAY